MLRYFTPVIFLLAAGYVYWYNTTHGQSVLLFPGIDVVFPKTAGDPRAQGLITAYLFGGLGVVFLINAIRRHVRDARIDRELAE